MMNVANFIEISEREPYNETPAVQEFLQVVMLSDLHQSIKDKGFTNYSSN